MYQKSVKTLKKWLECWLRLQKYFTRRLDGGVHAKQVEKVFVLAEKFVKTLMTVRFIVLLLECA